LHNRPEAIKVSAVGRFWGSFVVALAAGACAVTAATAGVARYADAAGDAQGRAADITGVVVRNGAAGAVTFDIRLSGRRSGLRLYDFVSVLLDTDRDPATGSAGADYVVAALGRPDTVTVGLGHWTGEAWDFTAPPGSVSWRQSRAGVVLTVRSEALGAPAGFDFSIGALHRGPVRLDSDVAPETPATWSFELG
jgi:hypothetical protein